MTSIEERNREVTRVENFRNNYNFSGSSLDVDIEESRSIFEIFLQIISIIIMIVTFPFSLFFTVRIVNEFERLVLFRFGRITSSSPKGPGFHILIPFIDYSSKVDLRIYNFIVPINQIVLSDSVCITIEAVVWAKVSSVISAVTATEDYYESSKLYAAAVVRKVLGSHTLADVVNDGKMLINKEITNKINHVTTKIGVKVQRIDLKNISLPDQLQRVMAREGIATRESKAMSLFADGERASAGHLTAASDQLDQTALSLRYMQTLTSINNNTDQGTTLFFPVPIDFGFWTFAGSTGRSDRKCDLIESCLTKSVYKESDLSRSVYKESDLSRSDKESDLETSYYKESDWNARDQPGHDKEEKSQADEILPAKEGTRKKEKNRRNWLDHHDPPRSVDIVTVHEVPSSA